MAKYKAFISYRKTHAENADLIKKALVEEYGFDSNEIFLDKHDIGPEYFDIKLKKAVESSSSLILVVTKDCFIPKENEEDWYLEEIQTALDNDITIIPILFDDLKSVGTKSQKKELEKSFDDDEINKLIKAQSIQYNFDLSDATFSKLSSFIRTVEKLNLKTKIYRTLKGFAVLVTVLTFAFALFVGIGFLWGYFSSGTDNNEILLDNTYIKGNTAIFDFGGLEAKYDLDQDSIFIDLEKFTGEMPASNFEIFVHSCSVSGAVILFNRNISALKYFKFLKGGSKYNKYAMAAVTIAACLGSFCGFSQGSMWGRTLKQQKAAITLFPKLKNKDVWGPVFSCTYLKFKYSILRARRDPLPYLLQQKNVLDSVNTIIWCMSDKIISIASEAGLTGNNIICKYNNWEIGKNTPRELSEEVEYSKSCFKDIVVLEVDSLHQEIKHYSLPEGVVGINIIYPNQICNIAFVLSLYNEWKSKDD